MFPLKGLPVGRPQYNAARLVFSRWEKGGKARTCDVQAMKDFEDSRKMICSEDGPCKAMTALERKDWDGFFDEVDTEQHLPAGPVEADYWIPETRKDVQDRLILIAKEKTPEDLEAGEHIRSFLFVSKAHNLCGVLVRLLIRIFCFHYQ